MEEDGMKKPKMKEDERMNGGGGWKKIEGDVGWRRKMEEGVGRWETVGKDGGRL